MAKVTSIISREDLIIPKLKVRPRKDFWSLLGSLKSKFVLSNVELASARQSFSKKWGEAYEAEKGKIITFDLKLKNKLGIFGIIEAI